MSNFRMVSIVSVVLVSILVSASFRYLFPTPPSFQLTDSQYLYFYKLHVVPSRTILNMRSEVNISEQSFSLSDMQSLMEEADFQQPENTEKTDVLSRFGRFLVSKGYGNYRLITKREMELLCSISERGDDWFFDFFNSNPCSRVNNQIGFEAVNRYWVARE